MTRAGLLAALGAILSHWRRAPLQLFTLIGGLALATALWSGVQAINAEARASYAAAAGAVGESRHDQILRADGAPVPLADYVALRRAGWPVSPVIEGRVNGQRIIGLDPLTAPPGMAPASALDGATVTAFLTAPGQIFARPETLAALADLGPAPVADPTMAPGLALTDVAAAARMFGPDPARLILTAPPPAAGRDLDKIAAGLRLRPADQADDLSRLTESFHLNLTAFGLLAFAVGIFIVHGAVGLAFAQRRAMIRTLRALGLPLATVLGLMAAEMAALALTAGAIGTALGYAIAAALLPDVALSLRGLYGAEIPGALAFRPGWWLSSMAIALGGGALASGRALWRVARAPLLSGPAAGATGGRRALLVAGLMLLAGAALLALTARGLTAGFALLGCLMLGAAALLPPLLALILRLAAARARHPVAQWFWADARQQLPALSLALMALLLAVATNIGVATMVSSFRLTFTGFLDQRLASELYVDVPDAATAARIEAFATAEGIATLPLLRAEIRLGDQPAELYGVRAHETYPANWRFLDAGPEVWDRLFAGEGLAVNEQLARRLGLTPGDVLDIGADRPLPILGTHGDYGNPIGQILIAEDLFRNLHPDSPALRFGLRLAPDRIAPAKLALTRDLGLPESALIDQAALKSWSLEIFERTFRVTGALNLLTLAVAGFAMLMSLLTLAAMRLPQLAPLWALGLRRADLGRLEFLRSLALAGLTGILALPLGLLLAWALLAVVNVAAFGWRLPMFLFPLDYARLFALTLVAAGLAAALPALRLGRIAPARLLKVFADER